MRRIIMAFLLCLLLLSCSSDSRQASQIDVSEEERPDMVLNKAVYTLATASMDPITITAGRITIDDKNHKAILEDVSFVQQSQQMTGRADHIEVQTKSHDATLDGNIRIVKESDGFSLEAQHVEWKNDSESITTGSEEEVTVSMDRKSSVRAVGFRGDLKTSTYEFSRITEGSIGL